MTTPVVLLVEDEESYVEALQVGLKREGFRVEVARDGFEALLPTLVKVAKSPKESTTDRLRAIDLLAKYGLGTTITETDTDGNDVARARLSPDEVAEHVARIVAQR